MGKGDKKTKRGKIFNGSYGVRRQKNKKSVLSVEVPKESTEVETKEDVTIVETPEEPKSEE